MTGITKPVPDEDAAVESLLRRVMVERTYGIVRGYDLIFTDKGIVFVMVEAALAVGIRTGIPAGVSGGMGGGMPGGEGAFIGGLFGSTLFSVLSPKKSSANYDKSTIASLLDDKYDFYVPYDSVKNISFDKRFFYMRLLIVSELGKVRCNFPHDSFETVRKIMSLRLEDKIDKRTLLAFD